MVAKVSAAFSENFSRIASVGEVRLHEDGDNYEKYAVHIMVRATSIPRIPNPLPAPCLPLPALGMSSRAFLTRKGS